MFLHSFYEDPRGSLAVALQILSSDPERSLALSLYSLITPLSVIYIIGFIIGADAFDYCSDGSFSSRARYILGSNGGATRLLVVKTSNH